MKTASDVILALESTSSRLDKDQIVRTAWKNQIIEFFEGANMAYNPLRTFGIKKVPLITEQDDDPDFTATLNWSNFKKLILQLEGRLLTGNDARDALRDAANKATIKDWNNFYRRILLKDFKCGVSDSTINKILKEFKDNGDQFAEKYIIPLFSCQLAKNGEDHPKKMKGPKLLDVKLDGVRLLSILNQTTGEVTQHSREGRTNDNFPHLRDMLKSIIPHLKTSMVLDAEVTSRSFQEMMKQLNRKSDIDTTDAKLALFDCLPLADFLKGEYKISQTKRHEALVQFQPLLDKFSNGSIYIIPKLAVDLDTEEGQKSFAEFNRETIEAGYEGVMVKDPEGIYRCKRTDAWLKIKPWITVDLEVVGVEAGKPDGKYANTLGGLVCHGFDQDKEIVVTIGSGFSDDLRDLLWKHKDDVIGRIIEAKGDVLTQNENSTTWSLRFPTFMQFRGWEPGEKI